MRPSDWLSASSNQFRPILVQGRFGFEPKTDFLGELICSLVTLSKSLFLLINPFSGEDLEPSNGTNIV